MTPSEVQATLGPPTWSSVGDIPRVVFNRRSLSRTIGVALVLTATHRPRR